MQVFARDHKEHEKMTEVFNDYVEEPPEKYADAYYEYHERGNDMVLKVDRHTEVTSKPPKHSCTAEIIAELERVLDEINVFQEHAPEPNETLKRINKAIFKRLNHYKAKETQL